MINVMQLIQIAASVMVAIGPLAWALQRRLTVLETKVDILVDAKNKATEEASDAQRQIDSLDRRVFRLEVSAEGDVQPCP